ncbi:MAG: signal peptidase I [Treponema sp.]|nr:signal peptidase I [Treponema sp.]
MKRIFILFYATAVSALLFSISLFTLSFGVEICAFPLMIVFTAIFAFVVLFKLKKEPTLGFVKAIKKLCEYAPFVGIVAFVLRRAGVSETSYALDFISVVFWVLLLVFSSLSGYFLKDKRTPFAFKEDKKKKPLGRRIFFEIADWIDAFVQAAFIVSFVNIFIFQLYAIPSESMIPQFLIGDRVAVLKTAAGPSFPLSKVALPRIASYKKGDIVVFRNPHYTVGRKYEVRTFVNQLVYMLTFSTVNLAYDESGQMLADPLVKRIAGVPGEQLVMVDGVLYSRTNTEKDFSPVALDAKFAEYNLNSLDSSIKRKIHDFPISEKDFISLCEIESLRKNLDIENAKLESLRISSKFNMLCTQLGSFKPFQNGEWQNFVLIKDLAVHKLFFNISNIDNLTQRLMTQEGGAVWFSAFMTDWASKCPAGTTPVADDPYKDSMYRLNILMKLTLGKLVVHNIETYLNTGSFSSNDETRLQLTEDAQKLFKYSLFNDSRNMPVFPENKNGSPSYIEKNEYFLMGDNRFNSLDLRHSYEQILVPVSEEDIYSLSYYSRLEPQTINASRILGVTILRFYPFNRFGLIQSK